MLVFYYNQILSKQNESTKKLQKKYNYLKSIIIKTQSGPDSYEEPEIIQHQDQEPDNETNIFDDMPLDHDIDDAQSFAL